MGSNPIGPVGNRGVMVSQDPAKVSIFIGVHVQVVSVPLKPL